MMTRVTLFALTLLLCSTCAAQGKPASAPPAAEDAAVLGAWEGESLCTVPSSPCHDEHVIYEIARDPDQPAALKVDAYKIVKGEKDFMGTLGCQYSPARRELLCHYRADDDWLFQLAGDRMTGTLHVGPQRTLYRRISLQRKRG
jgi:hypothetical protein